MKRIELYKGDITKVKVDAIVNAANNSLLEGGGVDGAIHLEAGPKLFEFCKSLNGCNTGEAKISPGFNLMAKFIIHTVGPVWKGGEYNEYTLLSSCYINSFKVATENDVRSMAFPSISTGVYRFPSDRAAKIAISETGIFLKGNAKMNKVIFVCFDEKTYKIYKTLLYDE